MTHLITATSGRWAPDTARRPHEWTSAALCRSSGADPEMWFSDPGDAREEAVAVCAVCPVRMACLEAALAVEAGAGANSRFGVYGGLTGYQRWAEYRRRREEG